MAAQDVKSAQPNQASVSKDPRGGMFGTSSALQIQGGTKFMSNTLYVDGGPPSLEKCPSSRLLMRKVLWGISPLSMQQQNARSAGAAKILPLQGPLRR
ncbi:hypothetical protein OPQ81_011973 [Rhizoctonia solani]|nr:hypothetical protein OPQ81_011973 [Rhizoctonia solani]